jgi:hypothetical protein
MLNRDYRQDHPEDYARFRALPYNDKVECNDSDYNSLDGLSLRRDIFSDALLYGCFDSGVSKMDNVIDLLQDMVADVASCDRPQSLADLIDRFVLMAFASQAPVFLEQFCILRDTLTSCGFPSTLSMVYYGFDRLHARRLARCITSISQHGLGALLTPQYEHLLWRLPVAQTQMMFSYGCPIGDMAQRCLMQTTDPARWFQKRTKRLLKEGGWVEELRYRDQLLSTLSTLSGLRALRNRDVPNLFVQTSLLRLIREYLFFSSNQEMEVITRVLKFMKRCKMYSA